MGVERLSTLIAVVFKWNVPELALGANTAAQVRSRLNCKWLKNQSVVIKISSGSRDESVDCCVGSSSVGPSAVLLPTAKWSHTVCVKA